MKGITMNLSQTNLSSVDDSQFPNSAFSYFCASLYAVIIAAATVGNILACLAFVFSPILRSSPTNHFIVSLAVSDLFTACLAMPFDMEQLLTNQIWTHGEVLCQVWTSTYLITVPSSIWSLFILSLDRYKSLKDPLNRFRQSPFMTRRRAEVVIAAVWVYSGMCALMPVIGWKSTPQSVQDEVCYFNTTPEYSLLTSFVNFVLPTLLMCLLYWRIYRIASQMAANALLYDTSERPAHVASEMADRSLKKKIKTTKNILVVACACFFCWMPHTVLSIISNIMFILCGSCFSTFPTQLSIVLLMLGYSSSALNPYLYALRNRKFKSALRKVFTPCRWKGVHWRASTRSPLSSFETRRRSSPVQSQVAPFKGQQTTVV